MIKITFVPNIFVKYVYFVHRGVILKKNTNSKNELIVLNVSTVKVSMYMRFKSDDTKKS